MRKLLLLVITIIGLEAAAQKSKLQGSLYDSLQSQPIGAATISLLKQADSSLVAFTMSDSRGNFLLEGIEQGHYRVLLTHVNFHNSSLLITVSDTTRTRELGTIYLHDKNVMLSEVIVSAEAPPVTLVGDTIQYNAGSFTTKPNAVVEDLLKKLPGVQVEKDGTVKAQGETVNRVLVDGKEFFGSDPKMATRNLPADAVDKVQVYDRQSDMAQLTGFDDGNSEKTINLKLKKDKKKGKFGKLSAGMGTDDRYSARFNLNNFKGARQLSFLGMANNTNEEGFSFMDLLSFTGAGGRQMGGGGEVNITISSDDPNAALLGMQNNQAINTMAAGGVNYNNIIGNRMEMNGNYFYSRLSPRTNSLISRQYLLPDSTYFYNQHSISRQTTETHRLNLVYDYLIDSFHSIKYTPSFSLQRSFGYTDREFGTFGEEDLRSNEGLAATRDNRDGYNFQNNLLFRKKTRRAGRTFSANITANFSQAGSDGFLSSITSFYKSSGELRFTDSLQQKNRLGSRQQNYSGKLAYTEPLFRRSLMEFSLFGGKNQSALDRLTYDYNSSSGKYDILNFLLSNDYRNDYDNIGAGFRIRTQRRNYNYSVGISWQRALLEGYTQGAQAGTRVNRQFSNLLPNARAEYRFSRWKTWRVNYQATTNPPTIDQLQPVPDLSNPLDIKEGNPGLLQEYTHRINTSYTGINPFRNKNLFLFSVYRLTNNKIVNYDILDSLGRKRSRPVNVNGVYNWLLELEIGLPLKPIRSSMQFFIAQELGRRVQFINSYRNQINTASWEPGVDLTRNFKDKLDMELGARLRYYQTRYSIQEALNTNYLDQVYSFQLNWSLPASFHLNSDFEYTISSNRAEGFNARVPLWNLSLSHLFLKYDRGEIRLSTFDLLNENKGINRTTNQNYIEDQLNRVVGRYFMLSFTYSLHKMSAGSSEQGGRTIIRR